MLSHQLTSLHLISLRTILTFSSYLYLGVLNGLWPRGFQTELFQFITRMIVHIRLFRHS
jgi:hypothetical protein